MIGFARPNNWSRYVRAAHHPSQGQPTHANAMLLGLATQQFQPGEGVLVPVLQIGFRAQRHSGASRIVTMQSVFTRQQASGQWAERRVTQTLVTAQREHLSLIASIKKAVR